MKLTKNKVLFNVLILLHLLFCFCNAPTPLSPLQSTICLEINIFFLLLLRNFEIIWLLSGARQRDCRGATSLNPISDLVHWAHLVSSSLPLFITLSIHCRPLHTPPPSPPPAFLVHWTSILPLLSAPLFLFFSSLRTNESILPAGMRPRWLNQIGARLYLDCGRRKRERERGASNSWVMTAWPILHQQIGWQRIPRARAELTILVILV